MMMRSSMQLVRAAASLGVIALIVAAYTSTAEAQSVCYQVKSQQNQEWLPEVCDGVVAGTTGQSRALDQFRVRSRIEKNICYRALNQDVGWGPIVCDNDVAGRAGKRLEAVEIWSWNGDAELSVEYDVHVQNLGWLLPPRYDGTMNGTSGQSKRLEALRVWIAPRRRCPDAGYVFPNRFQLVAVQSGRGGNFEPICEGALGFPCGNGSWCETKINNDARPAPGGWTTNITTVEGGTLWLAMDIVNDVVDSFYCINGGCTNLGAAAKNFPGGHP